MLVTFTYQSDDLNDELEESPTRPSPAGGYSSQKRAGGNERDEGSGEGMDGDESAMENQKSFTFWTKLTFGEVVPPPTLQPSASTAPASASAHPPSLNTTSSEPKNR